MILLWLALANASPEIPPEHLQVMYSARLCKYMQDRSTALAEIKTERRYSKIGGVVHLKRLGDLQDELREADEGIAEWKPRFKTLHRPPLKCTEERMPKAMACIDAAENGSEWIEWNCGLPGWAETLRAWATYEAGL